MRWHNFFMSIWKRKLKQIYKAHQYLNLSFKSKLWWNLQWKIVKINILRKEMIDDNNGFIFFFFNLQWEQRWTYQRRNEACSMRGSSVTAARSCLQPLVSANRYLAVHALPGDPLYFIVDVSIRTQIHSCYYYI